MNKITLRKAAAADISFTYEVREIAFRQYVEKIKPWQEEEQREMHKLRFAALDYQLIQVAGVDIGMVATSTHKECVNLHQIFILPAHQGLGIGTGCMGQIILEAENAQLPIQLRVQKVNPRAFSFFQKFAFKPAGETETHFLLERSVPLG